MMLFFIICFIENLTVSADDNRLDESMIAAFRSKSNSQITKTNGIRLNKPLNQPRFLSRSLKYDPDKENPSSRRLQSSSTISKTTKSKKEGKSLKQLKYTSKSRSKSSKEGKTQDFPTAQPITSPTASPTASPAASPAASPVASPTVLLTALPTASLTESPTANNVRSETVQKTIGYCTNLLDSEQNFIYANKLVMCPDFREQVSNNKQKKAAVECYILTNVFDTNEQISIEKLCRKTCCELKNSRQDFFSVNGVENETSYISVSAVAIAVCAALFAVAIRARDRRRRNKSLYKSWEKEDKWRLDDDRSDFTLPNSPDSVFRRDHTGPPLGLDKTDEEVTPLKAEFKSNVFRQCVSEADQDFVQEKLSKTGENKDFDGDGSIFISPKSSASSSRMTEYSSPHLT